MLFLKRITDKISTEVADDLTGNLAYVIVLIKRDDRDLISKINQNLVRIIRTQ